MDKYNKSLLVSTYAVIFLTWVVVLFLGLYLNEDADFNITTAIYALAVVVFNLGISTFTLIYMDRLYLEGIHMTCPLTLAFSYMGGVMFFGVERSAASLVWCVTGSSAIATIISGIVFVLYCMVIEKLFGKIRKAVEPD